MFRKTLDTGLKKIVPDAKGNLLGRIKSAAETGKITQDMADWADRIRLDGNDAAHEDDPFTPQQAEELHLFTRLVMMYLFSLPGMLEEWKTKTRNILSVLILKWWGSPIYALLSVYFSRQNQVVVVAKMV